MRSPATPMDGQSEDIRNAELFLCLARAFAIPGDAVMCEAMRGALVSDLRELVAFRGASAAAWVEHLDTAMTALGDDGALDVVHARLFLVPGDRHPSLNTAAYLDGAIAGGSMHQMIECYAACGLQAHSGFRDLPDHVTVQLEFVAWLYAARESARRGDGPLPSLEPEEFLARFVARWAPRFRAELEQAGDHFNLVANPYLALAGLTEELAHELAADRLAAMQAKQSAAAGDEEITRLRAEFAQRGIGAAELAEIRARLAADGLGSAHVGVPLNERDETMGMQTLSPPEPSRSVTGRFRDEK